MPYMYKGFYIHYHQDLGIYGIYRPYAVPNVVQAVQWFYSEAYCKKYIDKMC
jgi:hypothetical protein